MITVQEAKERIQREVHLFPLKSTALAETLGATLGRDVFAPMDIPTFEQSSMDGYAFRFADRDNQLSLKGEVQAGSNVQVSIDRGQAVRIFTGAALPIGADTVVMQEKIEIKDGLLNILDEYLVFGANIRRKGAEVEAGALAMHKGCEITPAAIGFLAGIGIAELEVYTKPVVGIIVTGDELRPLGEILEFGQIYESNSYSLTAALKTANIDKINLYSAKDDLATLTGVLQKAIDENDIVIITGGVSVGAYDFVVRAAEELNIAQLFHKVKQKPGKPLYVGKINENLVFGLPGNPSSVLSCFYQYVLPALEKMTCAKPSVKVQQVLLTHEWKKSAGLTHFLKAYFNDGKVTALSAQESFRMSSFAEANCMIELTEEETEFAAGTQVKIHVFPGCS